MVGAPMCKSDESIDASARCAAHAKWHGHGVLSLYLETPDRADPCGEGARPCETEQAAAVSERGVPNATEQQIREISYTGKSRHRVSTVVC